MIFTVATEEHLSFSTSLTECELIGRMRDGDGVMVFDQPDGRLIIGRIDDVTCLKNKTVVILYLLPEYGDLKSMFPTSGTLYLESKV